MKAAATERPSRATVTGEAALSLRQAAQSYGFTRPMLRDAALDGRIRFERTSSGGFLFVPATLEEDLAALTCQYDGCSNVAIGPTHRCGEHRFVGRTHSAETRQKMSDSMSGEHHHRAWLGRRHSDETRKKMSQTAMGRIVPLKARWKIAAALTIYPAEQRSCEWCGEPLGLMWGSRIQKGEGRFCCTAHHKRWEWDEERKRQRAGQPLRHFRKLIENGWSGKGRRNWKLKWSPKPGRLSKYPAQTRNLVWKLRNEGRSWSEIEDETGVPKDTARHMAGARQKRS
jgi:NUMOD3 motif